MLKHIYIAGIAATLFSITSCNLVDVVDVDPVNQLPEDKAIRNISQANSAMIGAYSKLKTGLEINVYYPGTACLLGGTMAPGTQGGSSEISFSNNETSADNYTLDAVYTKLYAVINATNYLILYVPQIETPDVRKNEVLGEAKFLRALCNFYLLRMFAQHYDLNSKFGIVLKTAPVESAEPSPRGTVKEAYDLILSDLDEAINKAPSFKKTLYASRQAAKGLKAKVLLYMKDYAGAAALAKQVIDEGPFKLENKFSDIWSKKIFFSPLEAMFQLPYDDKSDRNNKAFMYRSTYIPSAFYKLMLIGDNRDTAALTTVSGALRNRKFTNNTIPGGQAVSGDTEYFLRLAEMYLIRAEAVVRSNGNLQDARDAINAVRKRVEMAEFTSDDPVELLQLIRGEKIRELGAESGEEWFDLVRYASLGDIIIKNIRPGVISPSRYIMPIPKMSVQLSKGLVAQNPDY
ncbi:RagB/SusD family nutrient uptake outer membrane protein [Pseudoflavitalea sp. G-6-1-2]|uniref:RagB/SusD family nutrient uptake outer membrane protein n=1 Tax=Pseudoflavitalea sp. G-6-1-2 TaxID=2728841 RepID=UPI001469AE36|nr:RagB/SusD family nutrient uptake outer membrane protein [Pseudoflavitalea sp. G-6-1-2]NML24078.1 RagB/SusD family nutrient uptake outer membrane protein [Pseudoflavitalea sp. G-6-1-2]